MAADRIKRGNPHRFRRLFQVQLHSRRPFESPDVAALLADDLALPIFGWKLHHRNGKFRHVGSGSVLHRRNENVAAAILRFRFDLLLHLSHPLRFLIHQLLVQLLENHLARIFPR